MHQRLDKLSAELGLLAAAAGDLSDLKIDAHTQRDRLRNIFYDALHAEVDPLRHLATVLERPEALIYARAARYCGLAFHESLPAHLLVEGAGVDWQMGWRRSARGRIFDRDILFLAPDFFQFLRLGAHVARCPEKLRSLCVVPPRSLRAALSHHHGEALMTHARQQLVRVWRHATAHLELTLLARMIFVGVLGLLAFSAAVAPAALHPVFFLVMALLVAPPALLRLAAAWRFARADRPGEPVSLSEEDLPAYTIFVPLRDEANMVPDLAAALRRLDYPAQKLDIKFIVEVASPETIHAVARELRLDQFELVVVPKGPPATKPKALNFALPMALGELAVIFDAEDVPHPQQLRRAAALFAARPDVDCVQAELTIDNPDETWLTGLFAGEYAGLFGLVLPALAEWGVPLPLGGSSNHFRVQRLREIGGWDAFNVTEDADLGVRLSRRGLGCATLASPTFEEAPVKLGGWMRQRTRWMKGWMQTFLVHNRDMAGLWRDLGWRNFAFFQVYVGGLILSPLLHTVFLGAMVMRGLKGESPLTLGGGSIFGPMALIILVIGYGSAALLALLGLLRRGARSMLPTQALLPLYWVMMGVATLRAAFELVRQPYFWAKTVHGEARQRSSTALASASKLNPSPKGTGKGWKLFSRTDRM